MKHIVRNMSIQQKIAWTYSLLIAAIFICQMWVYNIFLSKVVQSKANDYIIQSLKQTNSKIETYINTIRIMSNGITSNSEIREIIMRNNSLAEKMLAKYQLSYADNLTITGEISKLTLAYDNINSVQIYTPYYNYSYNFAGEFENYSNIMNSKEGEAIRESRGELLLISTRKEFVDKYFATDTAVFSAVRKIYDYKTGQELGYLFLNIHETTLREIIEDVEIGTTGVVQLFDNDGFYISSANPNVIGTRIDSEILGRIDNMGSEGFFIIENDLIAFQKSDVTRWGVITRIPVKEVAGELNMLQTTNFMIGILGLLVVMITSFILSKELTKPLHILVKSMEKVRNGDLSSRVHVKSNDEIGNLSKVYNHMTEELQTLIRKNYEEQLSKKEAQLQAIQAQINPHFMYNTLDTIYWMLVLEGQDKTSELVISLSDIMRYSISDKDGSTVTLNKELQILNKYRIIQSARFENKLTWSILVPDELRSLYVPKMMIQPIIENSILHGMDNMKPLLTITVEAFIEDETLVIRVTDDGKGMSEEQVRTVLTDNISKDQKHTGFGLPGVNRRVKIRFGEEYGLRISSKLGAGTQVQMRLPIIKKVDMEDRNENLTGR
jgi:two-component system sensor histidine kinase YesM